jgi:hypothetical protein
MSLSWWVADGVGACATPLVQGGEPWLLALSSVAPFLGDGAGA